MAVLALISVSLMLRFQLQAHGTVPTAVGSAMEGGAALRGGRFRGLRRRHHPDVDRCGGLVPRLYTSLGGMMTLFNMQLGEVARRYRIGPVRHADSRGDHRLRRRADGRTHPEYLGKKITPREIKLAASYFLVTPLLVLTGTAIAMAMPGQRAAMLNSGPARLVRVLYAFTSAANNNGSAFAGLSVSTDWYNTALGLAMVLGRFLPIVLVLALAGSLAGRATPPSRSAPARPTDRSSSEWSPG